METSVKAAEVLVSPQSDVVASSPDADSAKAEAAAPSAASNFFDPMEEFSRRLKDIISTHGSAASLLDKQVGDVYLSYTYSLHNLNFHFRLLMKHKRMQTELYIVLNVTECGGGRGGKDEGGGKR